MIIRIKHYQFTLSEPFAPGHQLTGAEAQALNALRAENIRNNFAKRVDKAIAVLLPGEVLSAEALRELQVVLGTYDSGYGFVGKHEPRLKLSALEVEIRAVAQERVEEQARGLGKDLDSSELESLVGQMASVPGVQEEARLRLQERMKVTVGSLEDLL